MKGEMDLPEGKKCKDCVHCYRCTSMYGKTKEDKTCDFFPVKFKEVSK